MTSRDDMGRLEQAFARGNYAGVAMSVHENQWQVWAARGLIGLTEMAVTGLARFHHPWARFYEAAAWWIGGHDDRAEALLAKLDLPYARNLLALLRRDRIPVLAMLHGGGGALVLHDWARSDVRFALTRVGYDSGGVPNTPDLRLEDCVDPGNPPAFFVSQQIEWHPFPRALAALPCPLIGQTSDFFIHAQSTIPWLRVFDELIVTDHTEHAAVLPLVRPGGHASAYPKCYGHPADIPPFTDGDRPIDVLVTGTTLSPYHPDKSEMVRQLFSTAGIELAVVNGHLGATAYYELLGQAKFTVSHYRCGGGLITRSVEASALGCVPLVQRDNVLRFYASDQPALLEYDLDKDGLVATVRAALAGYPALRHRVAPTAEAVRSHLAPAVVASQYLRFCTVLAARPGRGKRPAPPPVAKRAMFWKGWCPGMGAFGDLNVIGALRRANATHWRSEPAGARPANELARDLLLDYFTTLLKEAPAPHLRDEALALWQEAAERWPAALVPRFNGIRAALHFGDERQQRTALEHARAAVEQATRGWIVEPEDDVLPYDFGGMWFNHRCYLDSVVEAHSGLSLPPDHLASLILASLAHYVSSCEDDVAMARRAVALDSGFAPYRMGLARLLSLHAPAEAVGELRRLCGIPLHAPEAWFHLKRLAGQGYAVPDLDALGLLARQQSARLIDAEAYSLRLGNRFISALRLGSGGRRGVRVELSPTAVPTPAVTLVAADRAGTMAAVLDAALHAQHLERCCFEVVYVELFDRLASAVDADVRIVCNPDGVLPHVNRGLNEGLLAARAPVVTVLALDAVPTPDLLERIAACFADGQARVVVQRDPTTEAALSLSMRLEDALSAGGFDAHHAYYAAPAGLEDLLRRLILAGVPGQTLDGTAARARPRAVLPAAMELVRTAMFPNIDAPDRARPRHDDPRLAARAAALRRGTCLAHSGAGSP